VTRWGRVLTGGLFVLQAGGGSVVSQAVDQINAATRRPVPSVGPHEVVRSPTIWVPDRWIPVPGTGGTALIPGHRELQLSEREFRVPPLTVVSPVDGAIQVLPAATRPPAETRHTP